MTTTESQQTKTVDPRKLDDVQLKALGYDFLAERSALLQRADALMKQVEIIRGILSERSEQAQRSQIKEAAKIETENGSESEAE